MGHGHINIRMFTRLVPFMGMRNDGGSVPSRLIVALATLPSNDGAPMGFSTMPGQAALTFHADGSRRCGVMVREHGVAAFKSAAGIAGGGKTTMCAK